MGTETKCTLTPEQQGAVVQAMRKVVHLGEDAGILFAIGKDDYTPRAYANRLFGILGMEVSFSTPEKKPARKGRSSR